MMLAQILRQVQQYQRTHGVAPNVVFINFTQFRMLQISYPMLFLRDPALRLGFRIAIMPDDVITHPQVAYLPSDSSASAGANDDPRVDHLPLRRNMVTTS